MTEYSELNRKLDTLCDGQDNLTAKVDVIDTTLRGEGDQVGIVARVRMVEKEQKRIRFDVETVKKIPGKVLWMCGGAMAAAVVSWISWFKK